MATTVIGLKKLRENVDHYIVEVRRGKTFLVVRRSKPLFKISSPDDAAELWEPMVDLTKVRRGGVPLAELLSRL